MIPKGLFAQIAMVGLSIAIIVTYVQPAFSNIGEVQDDISVYQEEREKVVSVNSQLSSLLSRLESVSASDYRSLNTYLPNEVDPIAVPRDLALITFAAGVIYNNASFASALDQNSRDDADNETQPPQAYMFNLSVEGTYPQLKNLFRLLEQNEYPLEVREVSIERSEGSFLSADISIVTYEYKAADSDNQIVF